MANTIQQDILERAAALLRLVAEGKSTSAGYFWEVTLALEALRDGNAIDAGIYYRALVRHDDSRQLHPCYIGTFRKD